MNEPMRFRLRQPLVLVASVVAFVGLSLEVCQAADGTVSQPSTRTNLAGQADIRIIGADYSTEASAPGANVRLVQREAPLTLPESAEAPQPGNGNSADISQANTQNAGPQDHNSQNSGPRNFVPQNPGPQSANGQAAPRQPAPAQRPLPLRPGEAQEIDGGWKPIGAVNFETELPPGEVPRNLAEARFARAGEIVAESSKQCDDLAYTYYWQASAFCCGPLYFEEPNLERYGYTHGILQPIISGAHFFVTIPALPYKMVVHPPHECVYSLGYYRPGDPAHRQRVRDPFRLDAATIEAALVVGIFLAAP